MRSTLVSCSALALLATAACRSASEGSPAREAAAVASDVARRTGAEAPPSGGDEAARAASRELLARPLTAQSAVKVALLRNAGIRESYERLGIARADLLQAGLIANPVFSANLKSFAEGPEVELGIAMSFVELFFVPLRRRVAAHELCAAQAQVTRELVHVVYDVRRAIATVRGADAVVLVRQEALAAVSAARDLMSRLHGAGNVRDADLTVEEVGAARARLDVDEAETLARDAREALTVLLGLGADETGWTLDPAPTPPLPIPVGAVEPLALAASLDLLEAKSRWAAALTASGLARRSGLLPHLDLGAVGTRESSDGAWGFGPEISTAIPIFDHGQARVLASNAVARQHAARHAQLRVEVGSAARRFADRARTLEARERYLRETYLPLRARYVIDTVQSFNAMQIGAFDVLDAKEGEADARREHAETATAAHIAQLDLAELLAGSLDRERLDHPSFPERADRPAPPKGH